MSMWVANRIICNEELKTLLLNWDRLKENGWENFFVYNDELITKISDKEYEVIVETHGTEYKDKEIRAIISKYNDAKVFCIEEEVYEEGLYYWNGNEVVLEKRKLEFDNDNCLLVYIKSTKINYCNMPRYSILISMERNNNLVIEDYDGNVNHAFSLTNDELDIIKLCCNELISQGREGGDAKSKDENNAEWLKIYNIYGEHYSPDFEINIDSEPYISLEDNKEIVQNELKKIKDIIKKYVQNFNIILEEIFENN